MLVIADQHERWRTVEPGTDPGVSGGKRRNSVHRRKPGRYHWIPESAWLTFPRKRRSRKCTAHFRGRSAPIRRLGTVSRSSSFTDQTSRAESPILLTSRLLIVTKASRMSAHLLWEKRSENPRRPIQADQVARFNLWSALATVPGFQRRPTSTDKISSVQLWGLQPAPEFTVRRRAEKSSRCTNWIRPSGMKPNI
jgi:hypothetical protein